MNEVRLSVQPSDITQIAADAIVNAANSSLLGGSGVDGAIHRVGGPTILAECKELRRTTLPDGLPVGQAVATSAGELPARWVIHTVGPIWDADKNQDALLASCYTQSLLVAAELGAESIAFPVISAGAYGWPMDSAVQIAIESVRTANTQIANVIFVPFGPEARAAFARHLPAD